MSFKTYETVCCLIWRGKFKSRWNTWYDDVYEELNDLENEDKERNIFMQHVARVGKISFSKLGRACQL